MTSLRSFTSLVYALGFLLVASGIVRAEPDRPRIGLALSGGGARGFAHIGVLRELERLRIPVDYVAGTSMGSIVGGLYATGMTADELDLVVRMVDWTSVFDDRTPRRELSFRRKQDSFDFLTSLRVWIKDFRLALPKGLIDGQKLRNLLTELSLPAATVRDFDDLPIPFRAVATDAATGEAVVLGEGHLVTAMFASMAIPAAFSPVEIRGKLLVDGGIAKNLPIDVVKAMGADIVIAVDISEGLDEAGEVESAFAVTGQSLTVLLQRNTEEQIALLTPDDLLIEPDLVGYGAASFDKGPEMIARGLDATREAEPRLERLSVSREEYAALVAERPTLSTELPVIESVRFDNRSPLSDHVIEGRFDVVVGQPLDLIDLQHDIATLYGEEIFDRVSYGLEQTPGGTQLTIQTYGKEQGRNFMRFGLELESDFEGESNFDLSALLTRNPVNSLAGEWRSRAQVGDFTAFQTEFFQPLTPRSRLFVLPSFDVGVTTRDLFNEGGDRVAKYKITEIQVDLSVGTHIGNFAELKVGGGYQNSNLDRTSGDPAQFPDGDIDGGFGFSRFSVDTLDSVTFPREGGAGFVEAEYLPKGLVGDDLVRLSSSFVYAFSYGDATILPTARFGTTFSDAEALPTFSLGGFLNLSGTPPESRTGSTVLLTRIIGYYRIANPRVISWSLPVYLGGSVEYGNTFDEISDLDGGSLDFAGSVFIGADTFLGPIYIAYGHSEGGNNAGYIFLGQVF